MKKSNLIIAFLFLFIITIWNPLFSQCVQNDLSFKVGEKITYEVAYNWGIIWVDAGEVYFKTDTIGIKGNNCFLFESYGKSYKFYDWIFKVRDRFQSAVDPEMFQPVWFSRETYEGGHEVKNNYDFDFINSKVVSSVWHSDKPQTVDTLDIAACTYDVLTAIYYARNIDFSTCQPGDTIPVKFIIDGGFYELFIRYLGKERIANRNGKKYNCVKFSAKLVEGTLFEGGEDLLVWVSDDKNKIPILVEAKILIGSVKAYLTDYEGLKFEFKFKLSDF